MAKYDISVELEAELKALQRSIKEVYGLRPNLKQTSRVYAKMKKTKRKNILVDIKELLMGD